MKYQVPQFIEVEDKIVGPFTIRQFIYLVGGAGMSFLVYNFLPSFIAIILIGLIVPLSLALAFYKINNKPFIDILEAAFTFYSKPNLYIWKKEYKAPTESGGAQNSTKQVYVPKLSNSKLKDLTWSLDVKKEIDQANNKIDGSSV